MYETAPNAFTKIDVQLVRYHAMLSLLCFTCLLLLCHRYVWTTGVY